MLGGAGEVCWLQGQFSGHTGSESRKCPGEILYFVVFRAGLSESQLTVALKGDRLGEGEQGEGLVVEAENQC